MKSALWVLAALLIAVASACSESDEERADRLVETSCDLWRESLGDSPPSLGGGGPSLAVAEELLTRLAQARADADEAGDLDFRWGEFSAAMSTVYDFREDEVVSARAGTLREFKMSRTAIDASRFVIETCDGTA